MIPAPASFEMLLWAFVILFDTEKGKYCSQLDDNMPLITRFITVVKEVKM